MPFSGLHRVDDHSDSLLGFSSTKGEVEVDVGVGHHARSEAVLELLTVIIFDDVAKNAHLWRPSQGLWFDWCLAQGGPAFLVRHKLPR